VLVVRAILDMAITSCMAESLRVSRHDSCERCPRRGDPPFMTESPRGSCHGSCDYSSRCGDPHFLGRA